MTHASATHLAESEPWIVRNGIGVQIMETLAVGAFLTALAVSLGAPNWMIGALAAIPHVAQIAQIPGVWVVEQVRNRRLVYSIAGSVARPMLLVIALSAVFLPPPWALWTIIGAFFVRYVAGAFLSCAWNSWMRDLVPDEDMGRLFSNRQQRMIGVGIVCSLIAAAFVDVWKTWVPLPTEGAYAVIYALAFIGGAYSVVCARRVHEPRMEPARHSAVIAKMKLPFGDLNYRRLIAFLGSWNFAVNLAAPFFTVYMLKRLEYELTLIIGLATLSQLSSYLTVKNWGVIADHVRNKAVLGICCPLFIAAIFSWTFLTLPEPHVMTLPLLVIIHIVMGLAVAGVNLATGNIALKLAPVGDATSYLAASSMINALMGGSAALLGGVAVDLFATWELGLTVHWQGSADSLELNAWYLSHWDFFFLFSAVVGLYALHRLTLVEEEGKVGDPRMLNVLIASARQGMRSLSTVAGLRAASDFPIDELMETPTTAPDRTVNQEVTSSGDGESRSGKKGELVDED